MKRWMKILMLPAVVSCTPPLSERWAHLSAEELFLAVEERYVNAPNVTWSSVLEEDSNSQKGSKGRITLRAQVSFEGNDKFRIAMEFQGVKDSRMLLQSDGVHAFMTSGEDGDRTGIPMTEDIGRILRKVVFRSGLAPPVLGVGFSVTGFSKLEDVDRKLPVSGLRFGLDTRILGLETRMIQYTLGLQPGSPPLRVSLWIDRKTLALFRREMSPADGSTSFEVISDTVFE